MDRSIGKIPFYIVNERSLKGVVNLAPLLERSEKSENTKSFVEHMKEAHG